MNAFSSYFFFFQVHVIWYVKKVFHIFSLLSMTKIKYTHAKFDKRSQFTYFANSRQAFGKYKKRVLYCFSKILCYNRNRIKF